ncbi:hypothetical protein DSO57_1030159 [Entomophthora muscae]|uniref:Uncharacterized protein n=1 Tax=Entomophthora muscae TaxID=34485 RepID=A0ACC2TNF1_9FUNG|nr:hypothetical protein DSO57_1030159 [Entomophthora muscae]
MVQLWIYGKVVSVHVLTNVAANQWDGAKDSPYDPAIEFTLQGKIATQKGRKKVKKGTFIGVFLAVSAKGSVYYCTNPDFTNGYKYSHILNGLLDSWDGSNSKHQVFLSHQMEGSSTALQAIQGRGHQASVLDLILITIPVDGIVAACKSTEEYKGVKTKLCEVGELPSGARRHRQKDFPNVEWIGTAESPAQENNQFYVAFLKEDLQHLVYHASHSDIHLGDGIFNIGDTVQERHPQAFNNLYLGVLDHNSLFSHQMVADLFAQMVFHVNMGNQSRKDKRLPPCATATYQPIKPMTDKEYDKRYIAAITKNPPTPTPATATPYLPAPPTQS